ncbi:serine/threonine-protein kinase [Wenzhouxiangella sp. XN24]|uniref:serine/threonine-protein kinase n=1 Tax=Wenzhouxiangella sp. XN24 TaxID=2713569 RepID=UPI0013ED0D8A|nr:serine/threonine-protein kinase [Wenzhouxiangella sp. XN24]NGX17037.1 serine/threonine protein kinase [Wenzhouxiangella sp. XN24]
MSPEVFAEVRALFDRVDELEPADRERTLERESLGRPEVVADVRRLLGCEGDRLAAVESVLNAALSAGKDRMAGPYRLESMLGEGGMGEVWLAEQSAPIRRKVAIKMIKAGMDTRQAVARFEAERQALATLSHPAIAAVLDAGETTLGRPYFVMEYVEGMPLDRYCDAHRLGLRARLRLFLRVCEGVQHAHNKALIHRDLKPANILVMTQEHGAQPKIIDFGVAMAISADAGTSSKLTEAGLPVGTPEYMSPEQLGGAGAVDTRTDVYSLGVTLCELVTGCLPQHHRPGGPSTGGDLDRIILKAIDPDPERRYESPRAFAKDIERFLAARPVIARTLKAACLV